MITEVLCDPVFDGVGPLIHKILHRGWQTSVQNRISYEDYFQEFVLLWLKRRKKYDPTRGKMTTFASMVALTYVRFQIKKAKHPKNHVYGQERDKFDISGPRAEFSAEELDLIEAYERQESKKAIGLAKRLCEATNTSKENFMETMEEIRTKVQARRQKPLVLLV